MVLFVLDAKDVLLDGGGGRGGVLERPGLRGFALDYDFLQSFGGFCGATWALNEIRSSDRDVSLKPNKNVKLHKADLDRVRVEKVGLNDDDKDHARTRFVSSLATNLFMTSASCQT